MGSEAVGDGCERLREAEDEVALGRDEEGEEAAMVTVEQAQAADAAVESLSKLKRTRRSQMVRTLEVGWRRC